MIVILLLTQTVALAAAEADKASKRMGEQRVYKKVGDRDLRLFVVNPPDWKAADQRPAILFFHGGSWVSGGPVQFNDQVAYFAKRGLVCAQVEYRLLGKSGTEAKDPPLICVQDARSAMRWVRSHAAELGVDPKRIASAGGSAGGHLAAFVGMVDGSDDPQDDKSVSAKSNAMVLFNPVFDNGPDDGWGTARVRERYPEFSPAHNISADDPPAIIFVGTKDGLIPMKVVERFQAGMKKVGVRCEANFYEGQPHGFFNNDPFKTKTLIEADKFLASLGWLTGPPTLVEPVMSKVPPTETKEKKKSAKREKSGESPEEK